MSDAGRKIEAIHTNYKMYEEMAKRVLFKKR